MHPPSTFSIQLVTIDTTDGRPLRRRRQSRLLHQRRLQQTDRHLGLDPRGRRGGLWLFTSEKNGRVPQGSPCPSFISLGWAAFLFLVPANSLCSAVPDTPANEPHQDTPAQNGSRPATRDSAHERVAHIAVDSQRATDSILSKATNLVDPELCLRRFAVIWGLAVCRLLAAMSS